MRHPVRTEFGSSMWLNRFQPDEALAIAEALVDAVAAARTATPDVE